MPSFPSLPRRAKTGRSGCVPELRIISDSSSSFTFFFCLQKELKKLAKVHGSAVPLSAGTPLPSTPATTSVPTQPPAPPPRMSTPTPVPRGVKREFEDSSLAQPSGPVPTTFISSGGVSPTSSQVQRPGAAKAGVPGARPRPVKKQRVVSYNFTLLSAAQSSGDLPVAVPIFASHPSSLRTQAFSLLTFICLLPTGHPRPSERHASASANTTAYSTGCVILSEAAIVRS